MSQEHFINSSLLDKAIIFATKAHKNTERNGKGFPYIVHPLEVVSIISTMSNDQELLAAGVLHDTVEDCDVSIETIEKEFGKRVADIVKDESDISLPGVSKKESWKVRKITAINCLTKASIESKIVALGDKLSNMRAIANDFDVIGNEVFKKFHVNDAKEIEWYYRELAKALFDLKDKKAYIEFINLIEYVFKN